jgi:hypothetical protein
MAVKEAAQPSKIFSIFRVDIEYERLSERDFSRTDSILSPRVLTSLADFIVSGNNNGQAPMLLRDATCVPRRMSMRKVHHAGFDYEDFVAKRPRTTTYLVDCQDSKCAGRNRVLAANLLYNVAEINSKMFSESDSSHSDNTTRLLLAELKVAHDRNKALAAVCARALATKIDSRGSESDRRRLESAIEASVTRTQHDEEALVQTALDTQGLPSHIQAAEDVMMAACDLRETMRDGIIGTLITTLYNLLHRIVTERQLANQEAIASACRIAVDLVSSAITHTVGKWGNGVIFDSNLDAEHRKATLSCRNNDLAAICKFAACARMFASKTGHTNSAKSLQKIVKEAKNASEHRF